MENTFAFRSPIFVLLAALLACCCTRKSEDGNQKKGPADVEALLKRGYGYQVKADSLRAAEKNDSAFAYYTKAITEYAAANDTLYRSYPLLMLAEIQKESNDYIEMQASTVEALKYIKPQDKRSLLTVYNNLGITYSQLDLPEKAIANYRKGIAVVENPVYKLTLENNIGNVYLNEKQYQKAYDMFRDASKSGAIQDSTEIKAMILDNLGYSAFHLGNKKESDSLMAQALKLRLERQDEFGATASYIHLMETSLEDNRAKSLEYARKADEYAQRNHSADDRLMALKFLSRYDSPENAQVYASQLIFISDSLSSAIQKNRNVYADIKYNFRLAKEKQLRAERDKAKSDLVAAEQESAKLRWELAAALIVLAGSVIVYALVQRHHKEKRKVSYDTEVRISKRLHDDLANDVHRTIVFAETQDLSDPANKDTLLDKLDVIYAGTRNISRETGAIPENENFEEYLRSLLREYNSDNCSVIIQGLPLVNWQQIDRLRNIEISRIVQELLTNMHKHSNCSHAVFSFAQNGKKVSLQYSDNGKGFGPKTEQRKNGLHIMENRISALGGTATFDSEPEKGFRAKIEISI